MHIENPDALKGWLTVKLAPLCDADPAALARYVCALLKKVKPEKELQASMQEQLDVFLGEETQPFLDRLMDTIRTEDYLKMPLLDLETVESSSASQAATASSQPPVTVREGTPEKQSSSTTTKEPSSDDDALRIDTTPSGGGMHSSSGGHSPIKAPIVLDASCPSSGGSSSTTANTNHSTSRRQQRLSARSRSRSRSRSPSDRRGSIAAAAGQTTTRNPRDSRDRLNRPVGGSSSSSAYNRNKSPPGRRFELQHHHHHRRGVKGGPYGRRNQSRSRSRSHSPTYRKASSRSLSPSHNNNNNNVSAEGGESRIQSQIVVGQKGKKCRDFEEKGYCMRGETCPWDHGVDPVVLEDINNPTLMTIQQQQHLREYNPDAPDIWSRNAVGGGGGGFGGPRGPIGGGGMGGRNGNDFHSQQQQHRLPFRLSSGQLVGGGGGAMMNAGGLSQLNRELIPVPVMMDGQAIGGGGGGMHHMMGMDHSNMGGGGGPKRRYEDQNQPLVPGMEQHGQPKRRPLAGRLGGRVGGGPGGNNSNAAGGPGSAMGQQNCSLELRKVPRGLNSIAHLNNHFSKFGKIINIQVNYENDPEAAIVTFSSHAEANVAYRSTEAVLNNRFIKVFWHNNNNSNNNGKDGPEGGKDGEQHGSSAPGGGGGGAPGVRKPNQYHLNNVLNKQQKELAEQKLKEQQEGGGGGDDAEKGAAAGNPPVAVIASPAQLRLRTNRGQAMRRKQEEQVKQAVQMAQDLMKKKHDLLQEYLKQMRSCLELIEKLDAVDPQRAKLLQTLKDLQGSIDKLRKEIADEQKQLNAVQQQQQQQHHGQHQSQSAVMRMTKEQQQKELLDLELELIAHQQEGNDTTHIQRRIQELQRALGRGQFQRGPQQGGGGAAGGGQMVGGRGRVAPPGSTSVDRRPTTIFVAGFKVDDSDALLGHFKHFGEITKNVLDQNIPSLIVSFAVRTHAEQAMQRGRIFKEKPLQMNWYIPNFVKQRLPEDTPVEAAKQEGSVKAETVEGDGSPEAATLPMSSAAEIKAEGADEEEEGEMLETPQEQDSGENVAVVKKEEEGLEKTELELEDELIEGAAGEEMPSGDVEEDELRLDDEEDDLEDRSWRR